MRTEAPWNHQREGLEWALARVASYMNIDMGLGKSRIGVEFTDAIDARLVLVLSTKRGAKHVWPGQYEDWSPRPWATHVMDHRSVPKRLEIAKKAIEQAKREGRPIALLANWEMLIKPAFIAFLRERRWDCALYDEMHKMKSHKGKGSKALGHLIGVFPRRLAFSGTPMPHDPLDVYGQFRALDTSIFGTRYWPFHNRYAIIGGDYLNPHTGRPCQIVGWQNLDGLREKLATIMYEPDHDTIEVELPSERHVRVEVELSPAGQRAYSAVEADIVLQIGRGEINPANALVKLLRLQQLAGGLAVTTEVDEYGDEERFEEIVDDAKEMAVAEIIDGTSEPVVVFCVFRAELAAVHRAAKSVEATSSEVSGSRDELEEWDCDGGTRVLAVQIAAGCEALDMTRARHCAFMSTGFNMGNYLQALKRVRRPGWEKYAVPTHIGKNGVGTFDRPVTYYHIIAKKTVDDRVYGTLLKRGDLVRSALEGLRALALA